MREGIYRSWPVLDSVPVPVLVPAKFIHLTAKFYIAKQNQNWPPWNQKQNWN